ncbi:MAG: N-6 DNA methylase, partial [Thermoleophilia bacterium]|nr:N-6 DNA methylase [Thermoleophilia bacterium]
MGVLETYLGDVRDTKLSGEGVSELSYYPALRDLFDEVGGGLKPKVRCFMNLRNRGAGLPDGGLFTADQVRKPRGAKTTPGAPEGPDPFTLLGGQKPARGAIEVKPPSSDIDAIAASEQVLGYLAAYRQVLVTNLREFLLLGIDGKSAPVTLERHQIAPTEAEFWAAANHPRASEQAQGERFLEFLKRVLLSGAALAGPQDLAWFLASYAREARFLTELAELPALDAVRRSLEDSLGVKFEGEKGEHFFRSTLVQTLFYGLFASWVLWSHDHEPDDGARFNWHEAAWTLRVPVVKALFDQIATPSLLGSLKLVPVLDLAAAALNRVDRAAFFSRFEQQHAVQYFYEPFLEAFDPALRKELGVWYTPPEIVTYMVARVDTVLREELDVPDGLADSRVYVLDPCCGTGAYLVEALERISKTLDEKGADALSAGEVKKAAMRRVFGFEILPAPFVIAHMQLGLLLQNMHLPLGDHERVGVFLTNALTGWEQPHKHEQLSALPELEAERDAAEHVKQELPILVILGNPPYNGYAGMPAAEERALTDAYRMTKKAPPPQGQGLNDLYVRFFRMAERRIVEKTGKGIVCFIS